MDKFTIISIVAGLLLIGATVFGLSFKLRPRKIKHVNVQSRWKDLQKLLAHKETWDQAIIDADRLLDDALKRLRFKGKSMGERMVSAQKNFTDNDSVWYAHKLRKKLEVEPETKLKERDVKDALIGIGQALRDIGALQR